MMTTKKPSKTFNTLVIQFPEGYMLGSYHFLGGGGDRLFVMAGRQFFSGPPLGMREKIPVPPFDYEKKYWSPPLPTKELLPHMNNERTLLLHP